MARKVLFLIHGIGQRAPDDAPDKPRAAADRWSTAIVSTLLRLATRHAPDVEIGLNPSADGIKVVPISYCDLFIRQLQAWDTLGNKKVADAVAKQFPGLPAQFVASLKEITMEDSGFFWNAGVDVLLYRVFHDIEIRAHVRQQITRALVDNSSNNVLPSCGFVAHSLGTAVLHDVLAELFANPQEFGGFVNMDVELYASLANVSKVLSADFNPHTSTVRPFGAPGQGRARLRAFLNAHHDSDPVAGLGLFDPKWDPSTSPYLDVSMSRIKEPDTHSYQRYVENPRVWIPIFRTLLETSITDTERDRLIAEYDATRGEACPEALDTVRQAASDLADAFRRRAGGVGTWQLAVAITKAYHALEDARVACNIEKGVVA